MCGGGGESADDIYKTIKPEFSALPSLSMGSASDRKGPTYSGVRTGSKRRSLLAPMMQAVSDA